MAMRGRVLVVDDDAAVRALVVETLGGAGYDCVAAAGGREALVLARDQRFDLVVLDIAMPGVSGDDVHRVLRKDMRTRFLPVMFLTAKSSSRDVSVRLLRGADDYVTKPFDIEELAARVGTILRRSAELRALNPLSQLPGNVAIASEIAAHLEADDGYACLYCDLDHFKEFNDHQGFARGDELIKRLSDLLIDVVGRMSEEPFVGHVGGDDFVVLVPALAMEEVARTLVREFDMLAPHMYPDEDRERGSVLVTDRHGFERRIPFVTLSIGIVPITPQRAADPVALARAASEMKEIAKRRDGSSWAVDRRQADVPAARPFTPVG